MSDEFANIDQAVMPSTEETDQAAMPSGEPENQAATPSDEQNNPAISEDAVKNHPLYKASVKGLNEAQKVAATYKKLEQDMGLSADDLTQAAQLYKFAQENPQEFYRQISQHMGQQVQPEREDEDDNPYSGDPLFQAAVAKQVEAIVKNQIEPLRTKEERREFDKLYDSLDSTANKLATEYSDSGINASELRDFCLKNKIPAEGVFHAMVQMMGGPEKYNDYHSKRAIAKFMEDAKKNQQTTSQTIKTTGTQATQTKKHANVEDMFADLNQSIAESWEVIKNQS